MIDTVKTRGAHVMAFHLFTDLRQFFSFAESRGWIEQSPIGKIRKAKAVGNKPTPRDRFLSELEITELCNKLPDAALPPTTEISIWIMLSTCCRVGELSLAQWQQINFDDAEWIIPAENAKNSKPHTIYLSDFTLMQFKALHKLTGNTTWCLPNRSYDAHIHKATISKQIKDRTRTEPLANRSSKTATLILAGGTWTPHDLRRTSATLMRNHGVSSDVVERCLNHQEQNILIRTYQHKDWRAECQDAWRVLGHRLAKLTINNEDNTTQIIPLEKHSII